ncbi:hypothetical protein [Pedobacter sp. V48]|uniref:hypothetical protein n=1 Tax=Pedobacter sp. V48 TaxID=509635 RepID=UPI0003E51B66|nr:hypothetical protein [Pedobacter sp. V48]ETZ21861.1 hypothetical protein N824_26860 [Pedobacter sp. V48]
MVKLSEEQFFSFNRLMSGWVAENIHLTKALVRFDNLIVLDASALKFDFNGLSQDYQKKFVLNNFELYCTSLFLTIKPRMKVFVKNEGFRALDFHCIFALGKLRHERIEKVSTF